MLKKITNLNYIVIAVLLLTFNSCSKQKEVKDILSLAENIVEQHPDSALQLLNTVLFPEELNNSLFNKYNLLMFQAKDKCNKDITSDTVIFAVKDYYVRKKDIPKAALAAFYCGRLCYERKDVEKATEAYMESEQFADQTDNYNLKGLIQSNWAILHRTHASYDKAIELLKNSIEMYDKTNNYKNKISVVRLIGDCFLLSNKTDSAFYYYDESLRLSDFHNIPELKSGIKQSMGMAYRKKDLYEQAKKFFNEAFTLPCDSVEKARILLNIAQIFIIENNLDSVNYYLDKALVLQISNPALMRTSYILKSNIAEKNKQYEDALNYYKEYYHYTKEVFDNEKNNKLIEIQGKYDFEKLRNSQKESELKHQKTFTALLLSSLVAGIIAFLFYIKSEHNKKLLFETEQKVTELQRITKEISNVREIEKELLRNKVFRQIDIVRKTLLIGSEMTEDDRKVGEKFLKKFNKIVLGQSTLDWNNFYPDLNFFHNGFLDIIKEKYPQWNETKFRIFCLSCGSIFNDTEIAIILLKKISMVRKIRNIIREDMGISKYSHDFVAEFKNK